jgi:hypothetical protein
VAHRIFPLVQQHETHRQLVGRARPVVSRRVRPDAIIVPASRPAANLDQAIALAQAVNCRLVVLCSRQADAIQVSARAAARRFRRAIAVDLPADYDHELLRFASSALTRKALPGTGDNPNGDLSVKRNLGLLLARMMGWQRIFFMDDDIRDVTPVDLYTTVAMLGRYRSAALRVTDFPDNSVVCHAHRETGADQDIFVSGSVLAVHCVEDIGFFPDIYNEDWLFFYDDARARRLGWSGRNAAQLNYDPFDGPRRAERQEFGDVIAEGLYGLLDNGVGETGADCEYWKKFLDARWRFLENIIDRRSQAAQDKQVKIISTVLTAMISVMHIEPKECETFVKTWRKDLANWADSVQSMPRTKSVDVALAQLGLKPAERGYAERSPSSVLTGTLALSQAATLGLWAAWSGRNHHYPGLVTPPIAPPVAAPEIALPGAALSPQAPQIS